MKLEGSIAHKSIAQRSAARSKRSRHPSASVDSQNQVSRWVLAYEKSLSEFAQLLANAAQLRALYDSSSPQP
jgi:hypothetical protein